MILQLRLKIACSDGRVFYEFWVTSNMQCSLFFKTVLLDFTQWDAIKDGGRERICKFSTTCMILQLRVKIAVLFFGLEEKQVNA